MCCIVSGMCCTNEKGQLILLGNSERCQGRIIEREECYLIWLLKNKDFRRIEQEGIQDKGHIKQKLRILVITRQKGLGDHLVLLFTHSGFPLQHALKILKCIQGEGAHCLVNKRVPWLDGPLCWKVFPYIWIFIYHCTCIHTHQSKI